MTADQPRKEVPMEPPKEGKVRQPRTKKDQEAKPRRFKIVKLEERIAPKLASNHNETLVADVPTEGKVRQLRPKKGPAAKTRRFQIVKLEERIAPRLAANHNETLVADRR
jgi:hypothetical protein